MKAMLLATVMVALSSATSANADVVNFDEFTSPPVTGFYADTGVTGPLVYPNVTVVDGDGSGYVMNGSGWLDLQTSGYNLFGTGSRSMSFNFGLNVSNVVFDLINGFLPAPYTISALDGSGGLLGSVSTDLTEFATPGSTAQISFLFGGIRSVQIAGPDNFAVDTLIFDTSAVPEPASWAMMVLGFGILGSAMRRRATTVGFA